MSVLDKLFKHSKLDGKELVQILKDLNNNLTNTSELYKLLREYLTNRENRNQEHIEAINRNTEKLEAIQESNRNIAEIMLANKKDFGRDVELLQKEGLVGIDKLKNETIKAVRKAVEVGMQKGFEQILTKFNGKRKTM